MKKVSYEVTGVEDGIRKLWYRFDSENSIDEFIEEAKVAGLTDIKVIKVIKIEIK